MVKVTPSVKSTKKTTSKPQKKTKLAAKKLKKTTKKSTVIAEPKKRGRPRKLDKLKSKHKRGRPKKPTPSVPGKDPKKKPSSIPPKAGI